MATQLTVVNNILSRLREDEVSSVAESSYSKLIAQFVNDAIADIEEITVDWEQYRTNRELTILGDGTTTSYNVDDTNDRTWIVQSFRSSEIPLVFDVTTGELGQCYQVPNSVAVEVIRLQDTLNNPVPAPRTFYTSFSNTPPAILLINLLQPSTTERTWRVQLSVPQDILTKDGDDDNTEILLPSRPVELRALYYALNERGEEMGEPGGIAWQRSVDSIGAALENNKQILQQWELTQFTNQETL